MEFKYLEKTNYMILEETHTMSSILTSATMGSCDGRQQIHNNWHVDPTCMEYNSETTSLLKDTKYLLYKPAHEDKFYSYQDSCCSGKTYIIAI